MMEKASYLSQRRFIKNINDCYRQIIHILRLHKALQTGESQPGGEVRVSEALQSLQDKFRGLRDLAVRVSHLQSRHDHPLQSQGGEQPQGRSLVVVAKDGGVGE